MFLRKLFPYALAACSTLGVFSFSAAAQTIESRPRQVAQFAAIDGSEFLIDDSVNLLSVALPEATKTVKPVTAKSALERDRFEMLISAAIDERLGSRYRWGATGPNAFDCSGFVWSIFQSAGINFERSSARTLWHRFEAPSSQEQFKFGTLVFFSGLKHIGVVTDEHGFYHASRHHGVVYSPFNNYWVSRIDGFRRVPLPVMLTD